LQAGRLTVTETLPSNIGIHVHNAADRDDTTAIILAAGTPLPTHNTQEFGFIVREDGTYPRTCKVTVYQGLGSDAARTTTIVSYVLTVPEKLSAVQPITQRPVFQLAVQVHASVLVSTRYRFEDQEALGWFPWQSSEGATMTVENMALAAWDEGLVKAERTPVVQTEQDLEDRAAMLCALDAAMKA
jgi:hypothetical protein